MTKLTIQAFFGEGKTYEGPPILAYIGDFNFLCFSGVLFLISIALILFGSMMTPAPGPEKIAGMVYGHCSEEELAELKEARGPFEIGLSIVVIGLVLGVYLYFSFWL